MMSMFVLFNVAVMRWSARTSMTRSRSLLGDVWMDEYHIYLIGYDLFILYAAFSF